MSSVGILRIPAQLLMVAADVNQYTVIMDVLFPSSSSGKARTLFVTDIGGEILVNAGNALAIAGGTAGGNVTPDVWHRVAVTVDTASTISLFIDGIERRLHKPLPEALMDVSRSQGRSTCSMARTPIRKRAILPASNSRTKSSRTAISAHSYAGGHRHSDRAAAESLCGVASPGFRFAIPGALNGCSQPAPPNGAGGWYGYGRDQQHAVEA